MSEKRKKPVLLVSYIASGARTDIQNLLVEYEKLNTVRYDAFAKVWREMKFSHIFLGRQNFNDVQEFTEEVFRIAKDYWLPVKPSKFNYQVGGLYFLYGLYHKQPTFDVVKIRITLNDCSRVTSFRREVITDGHLDANFIFNELFQHGAFEFCFDNFQYGLEKKFRKYFEGDKSLLEDFGPQKIDWKPPAINVSYLDELEHGLRKYHSLKCVLKGSNSTEPDDLLGYVNPYLASILKKLLTKGDEPSSEMQIDGRVKDQTNQSNNIPVDFIKTPNIHRKSDQRMNRYIVQPKHSSEDNNPQPCSSTRQTSGDKEWWSVGGHARVLQEQAEGGDDTSNDEESDYEDMDIETGNKLMRNRSSFSMPDL